MQKFTIRDIESIIGIKAHTIRIWEKRYSILKPNRTETNIRYYSDEDLKLLLNVAMLNREGERISTLARLSHAELNEKVMEYASRTDKNDLHIQALISATINLDEKAFEKIFEAQIKRFGLKYTIAEIIFPLMKKIGELWMSGTIHPAYEHFISNLIRNKLIVATADATPLHPKIKRRYLLFLPENEHHELGLLFANYLIRSHGHESLFIGQGTPVAELEMILDKFKPDFVFSSFTMRRHHISLSAFAETLHQKFPQARLIFTGSHAIEQRAQLPGYIHVIQSVNDFLNILKK